MPSVLRKIKTSSRLKALLFSGLSIALVVFVQLGFPFLATAEGVEPAPGSPTYQAAQAQVPAAEAAAQSGQTPAGAQKTFECSWTTGWDICFSDVVYVFTVGLMNVFAYIGAYVFDFAVQITLNSLTYSQSFLSTGWATVRDLANMAFIFILVYIAVKIIFEAETAGTMRMLAVVIIMALLINFSFFISRVVIDAGNILAVQFYNAIPGQSLYQSAHGANSTYAAQAMNAITPNYNFKDLTGQIMQTVGVQSILGTQSFSNFAQNANWSARLITLCFVYIATGLMMALLGFVFLATGIKFLVRSVVLWLTIVAAPVAFVARALTNNSRAQGLYRTWEKALVSYSFFPAIFLFMFWIINTFATQMAGSGTLLGAAFQDAAVASSAGGFIVPIASAVASMSVRLGLLIALLYFTLRASDWLGNESHRIANWASGTMGSTLSRSIAFAGRNSVGWASHRFAESDRGKKWESSNVFARTVSRTAGALSRSTYDVRNAPGVKTGVQRTTGVDLGKGTDKNYAKQYDARVDRRVKAAGRLKPSELQIQEALQDELKNSKNSQEIMDQIKRVDLLQKSVDDSGTPEDRAALKVERKELDRLMEPINKAVRMRTGANNVENYATYIGQRSWRNLWGGAFGTPGWISTAHKDAAARILRADKKEVGKLLATAQRAGLKAGDDVAETLEEHVQETRERQQQEKAKKKQGETKKNEGDEQGTSDQNETGTPTLSNTTVRPKNSSGGRGDTTQNPPSGGRARATTPEPNVMGTQIGTRPLHTLKQPNTLGTDLGRRGRVVPSAGSSLPPRTPQTAQGAAEATVRNMPQIGVNTTSNVRLVPPTTKPPQPAAQSPSPEKEVSHLPDRITERKSEKETPQQRLSAEAQAHEAERQMRVVPDSRTAVPGLVTAAPSAPAPIAPAQTTPTPTATAPAPIIQAAAPSTPTAPARPVSSVIPTAPKPKANTIFTQKSDAAAETLKVLRQTLTEMKRQNDATKGGFESLRKTLLSSTHLQNTPAANEVTVRVAQTGRPGAPGQNASARGGMEKMRGEETKLDKLGSQPDSSHPNGSEQIPPTPPPTSTN